MKILESSIELPLISRTPNKKIPAAALDLLEAIKNCDHIYEYNNSCYLHPKGKAIWHGVIEPDQTYEINDHKFIWKSGKDLIESAYLVMYTTPEHNKGYVDLHWFSLDILEVEVKQFNERSLPDNKSKTP